MKTFISVGECMAEYKLPMMGFTGLVLQAIL